MGRTAEGEVIPEEAGANVNEANRGSSESVGSPLPPLGSELGSPPRFAPPVAEGIPGSLPPPTVGVAPGASVTLATVSLPETGVPGTSVGAVGPLPSEVVGAAPETPVAGGIGAVVSPPLTDSEIGGKNPEPPPKTSVGSLGSLVFVVVAVASGSPPAPPVAVASGPLPSTLAEAVEIAAGSVLLTPGPFVALGWKTPPGEVASEGFSSC